MFCLLLPAARGAVTVQLAPEAASLFVHEPFTLRLVVQSDSEPDRPELPAVPGLGVITIRRLPVAAARPQHGFQITLIAERDGIVTVPPFAVQADDETVWTPAVRLRINAPRPAAEMTLAVHIEPTALRVGQPALLTATWTSAVAFARCKQLAFEIPVLADERCQVFPLDPPVPEAQRIGLPVNNLRVIAQTGTGPEGRQFLTFRFMLVPREPGVLRAQPARLAGALLDGKLPQSQYPSYFYNHFFAPPDAAETYERVYLAAPVPALTVKALPAAGRTGHFAGIIGPCDLRTSVVPTDLAVGQPALFTVHLDQLVFARQLAALPAAAFAGLRPEFQLAPQPIRDTAADHARSFTFILRPLRAGLTRIPAVVIQTFDPDSGQYHTLRSAPLAVTVAPDNETAGWAGALRADARPPLPLTGIRHNRLRENKTMTALQILEFCGRYWWAFVGGLPLLWLALRPWFRHVQRCRRDPVYARATTAWRRFRQAAWRDEETAWRHYLADRLALCAEALTADTIAAALAARQVEAGLIAEIRRRFEEQDATAYGQRPARPARSVHALVRRLHKVTGPVVLLISLLVPVLVRAADHPDDLFARAQQLQGEKPDEAQPLFAAAALQFESAQRFLNAGNSWFFAGENGRALANYRAAERRHPFDRQVRESIAFLRAHRADAFAPPAMAGGRLATFWRRFGEWAPVLRAGLLVLVYLLAWVLFLVAQWAGWRIRPGVWVVLAALALGPAVSLVQSSLRPAEGVVIEDSVARLGPGYAYDPAFEQPLHQATEFVWLETRDGWVRARLPDKTETWLAATACGPVQ